jgi:hypothetical protein
MARMRWGRLLAALALALATGVGACRETERNRPLDFQPHVYKGQKLPSLTEQQQRELQERGNLQK